MVKVQKIRGKYINGRNRELEIYILMLESFINFYKTSYKTNDLDSRKVDMAPFFPPTTYKVRIRDPSRIPPVSHLGDVWEGSEAGPWKSLLTQVFYNSTAEKEEMTW